MNSQELSALAVNALDDLKGIDVVEIDISEKSSIADMMIVATGTSQRHVKSLANNVRQTAKDRGMPPIGVEGEGSGEWVLVDLGDVIVHVMTAETREFYSLEKLWSVSAANQREEGISSDEELPSTGKSDLLSSA